MARISTYLNFKRNTEEAFKFYKSVFDGKFVGDISRFRDIPSSVEMPSIPEEDKNLIMHIALELPGDHIIMGTDAPESMGFKVNFGNNVYISVQLDTRDETRRLFKALSEGGRIEQELKDMFWGDYYCSLEDKFGVHWMLYSSEKPE